MKKLLIVVDFQKDFVDGALGFAKAAALDCPIADKITACRADGWDIAFTFDTHTPAYLGTQEGKKLPVPHCVKGTDGWELYGQVAVLIQDGDRRFEKPSFGSAELFDYLRNGQYERVELVGLVSNICVAANAILAKTALPEAAVSVDAACTASFDDVLNNAALDVLAGLQVEVTGRYDKHG